MKNILFVSCFFHLVIAFPFNKMKYLNENAEYSSKIDSLCFLGNLEQRELNIVTRNEAYSCLGYSLDYTLTGFYFDKKLVMLKSTERRENDQDSIIVQYYVRDTLLVRVIQHHLYKYFTLSNLNERDGLDTRITDFHLNDEVNINYNENGKNKKVRIKRHCKQCEESSYVKCVRALLNIKKYIMIE